MDGAVRDYRQTEPATAQLKLPSQAVSLAMLMEWPVTSLVALTLHTWVGAEGERDSRGGGIGGGVSCGDNALSAAAVTGDGARDSRTAGGDSVMASGSVRPNGIEDAEAFGGSRGERLVAGGTGDGVAL